MAHITVCSDFSDTPSLWPLLEELVTACLLESQLFPSHQVRSKVKIQLLPADSLKTTAFGGDQTNLLWALLWRGVWAVGWEWSLHVPLRAGSLLWWQTGANKVLVKEIMGLPESAQAVCWLPQELSQLIQRLKPSLLQRKKQQKTLKKLGMTQALSHHCILLFYYWERLERLGDQVGCTEPSTLLVPNTMKIEVGKVD